MTNPKSTTTPRCRVYREVRRRRRRRPANNTAADANSVTAKYDATVSGSIPMIGKLRYGRGQEEEASISAPTSNWGAHPARITRILNESDAGANQPSGTVAIAGTLHLKNAPQPYKSEDQVSFAADSTWLSVQDASQPAASATQAR